MEFLYLVLGLAVGIVIGCLIVNGKKKSFEARCSALKDDNTRLSAIADEQRSAMQQLTGRNNDLDKQVALLNHDVALLKDQLETSEASHAKALKQKDQEREQDIAEAKEQYKQLREADDRRHADSVRQMSETFNATITNLEAKLKLATDELLKARQQEFSDSSKTTLSDLVDPLNQSIAAMKKEMEGYTAKQQEFKGSMEAHIADIRQEAQRAYESASELTTALKHDTKVQGDYGEVLLDQLLAKQGLTQGIHYELQYVERDASGRELKAPDGKGRRPDVVVHLDTKRDVVIDSKMNLTDFIAFANAETTEERQRFLERHVRSMEAQVNLLSKKDYTQYHKGIHSRMDFVIMFVPISAAFWEAMRCKPSLWQEAMDKGVFIAHEQTLFAALRIIRLTWTQIDQVENQNKIFELANTMIERVEQFAQYYKEVGDAMNKMQRAYDNGSKKLSQNGHSIVTTAQHLIKLGAKCSSKGALASLVDVDQVEQLSVGESSQSPLPSRQEDPEAEADATSVSSPVPWCQ